MSDTLLTTASSREAELDAHLRSAALDTHAFYQEDTLSGSDVPAFEMLQAYINSLSQDEPFVPDKKFLKTPNGRIVGAYYVLSTLMEADIIRSQPEFTISRGNVNSSETSIQLNMSAMADHLVRNAQATIEALVDGGNCVATRNLEAAYNFIVSREPATRLGADQRHLAYKAAVEATDYIDLYRSTRATRPAHFAVDASISA